LTERHLRHPDLANALKEAMPNETNAVLRGYLTAGGEVMKRRPATSVHPAWRRSYVHLVGTNVTSLKILALDTGAYLNEVRISSLKLKALRH
jgi:hypothetical protein